MTLYVNIGRRVPKKWYRRLGSKLTGLITFQENIWNIITQSINKAKRAASRSQTLTFIKKTEFESEDMYYNLEWIRVVVQGTEAEEQEEHKEAMMLYKKIGKAMKEELPTDSKLSSNFKTKILNSEQVQAAYKEGHGTLYNRNMANKLLELGILTHVELIEDYGSR